MINHKLKDLNIPFGLCQLTYGEDVLPGMGSEGIFSAIPTYKKLFGGAVNTTQKYILQDFKVSFEVSFNHYDYDMLKMYMPTLQSDSRARGLYDSSQSVSMTTKPLIIHPYEAGESREYDINIFAAYIDPETEFKRTFGKQIDKFTVKFIGTPYENPEFDNFYFLIGDLTGGVQA